jgi:hypothetical protein
VVAAEEDDDEDEGAGEEQQRAFAHIQSLPWATTDAPAPAPGPGPLTPEQAGRMVALSRRELGRRDPAAVAVRLFADVLSWRRGRQHGTQGRRGVGEQDDDCVDLSFEAEGAMVTVTIRPFLLVNPLAVRPLQQAEAAEQPRRRPPPPQSQPPPPPLAHVDWRGARLAPALSLESRRARSDEYWDAPPLRLLVLVKRVEQQQYGGGNGASGRVVLLCRDANDPAPAVARLFLYASHRVGASILPVHLSDFGHSVLLSSSLSGPRPT